MKKRNIFVRILLLITLCLSIIVPISYARYIEVNTGSGNLDVAKWDIILNGENIDEVINLDLFETINDSNLKNGTKIIAPGIDGSITLNIKNESDVVAESTIVLEELLNNDNIPIVYSLEANGEYVGIADFEIMDNEVINPGEIKEVTVYWQWPFYQTQTQNNSDSDLGIDGTALFEIGINIKVNQKVG